MAVKLYNLARMTTTTAGTEAITLGAAVPGFLSFVEAGIQDGDIVSYGLKEGDATEVGRGTYSESGGTLTRDGVVNSTNGGDPIELSGSGAEVYITPLAADFIVSYNDLTDKPTLGTAAATDASAYATAAQGALADSATQPGDLSTVATTGSYNDLTDKPTLGTAAAHAEGDFATAAQGAKADSAVQPGALAAVATSGSYNDLVDKPTSIGRELLTAARTYYVRTDGSDSNSGLANTSGGAFVTIQKALDVCLGMLDIGGQTVTIQVATGTYSGGVTGAAPQVGAGTIQIIGDTSTLTNVVISGLVIIKNQCVCTFDGISFAPSTGTAVTASNAGIVYLYRVHFAGTPTTHVRADVNGILSFMSDYTIAASAQRHARVTHNGIVQWNSGTAITVTLTGTPNFSFGFVFADGLGYVVISNTTFSGSATGKRYDLTGNSVVNSFGGSTSLFPGSIAGTTGTGGQYI